MEKNKKLLVSGIIAAVVAVVITVIVITVNSVYVFIGGEAIRKDSTFVQIEFWDKNINRDLKKLDRFSEMNQLRLEYISDDVKTEYIPKIKRIESLGSVCSKIKNTNFLNNFENIQRLHPVETVIDFERLSEDASIGSLELWSSNTKNFKNAGKCKALKKLEIFQCNLDDGDGLASNGLDSKIFSGFDHVESIEISNMKIPGISGFLEMKSLKNLTIKRYLLDEPPITDEQADELRKAGIDLTLDNEKFS